MKEAVDDVVRVPEWATPSGLSTTSARRVIPLAVGYVALYLALDRLSFIGALHGIGITPWSPSAGLAMALLIIKGLRCAPLVMAAELLSSATIPVLTIPAVPVCLGVIVTMISSGLVASGFVVTYADAGVVPWSGFAEAVFHFWIGDAIGIVVLLPPLLLLHERVKQRAPLDHGGASYRFVEA